MTFLRVIQKLLNMLIHYIFPQNVTRDIFCSANSSQAMLCSAVALEWLRHIPFRTRIEECDRSAFCDRHHCTNLPFCDIDDSSRCTRVIHVNQIRIELSFSISQIGLKNLEMLVLAELNGRVGFRPKRCAFDLGNQLTFFKILKVIRKQATWDTFAAMRRLAKSPFLKVNFDNSRMCVDVIVWHCERLSCWREVTFGVLCGCRGRNFIKGSLTHGRTESAPAIAAAGCPFHTGQFGGSEDRRGAAR